MHRQPKPYLPASHFEINMTQHLTKSDENYFYTHEKHIYPHISICKNRNKRQRRGDNKPRETKQKTNLKTTKNKFKTKQQKQTNKCK